MAFGATIGGYSITESSLYSGVKETVGNTTRGVYLDNDGQFAVGDASNYLKFFQDTDGTYKLEVSASSVKFSSSGKSVEQAVNDAIVSTVEQFYLSTSSAGLSGGSWSTEQPTWEEGKYIWRRTLVTYGNGTGEYTPSAQGVCITGNTGARGDKGDTGAAGADAITMAITSSSGTIFKNTDIATTLTAHVYKAGMEVMGSNLAALGTIKWYKDGSSTPSATGSTFTISAGDITNKASYEARLEA